MAPPLDPAGVAGAAEREIGPGDAPVPQGSRRRAPLDRSMPASSWSISARPEDLPRLRGSPPARSRPGRVVHAGLLSGSPHGGCPFPGTAGWNPGTEFGTFCPALWLKAAADLALIGRDRQTTHLLRDARIDAKQDLADLIRRAQEGDRGALDLLFARYLAPLRAWLDSRLESSLKAKLDPTDVVQSALGEALHDFGSFEYRGPGSFYQWLRRILERRHSGKRVFWHAQRRDVRRERSSQGLMDAGGTPGAPQSPRQMGHLRPPSRVPSGPGSSGKRSRSWRIPSGPSWS
jgi:hypothetical protein